MPSIVNSFSNYTDNSYLIRGDGGTSDAVLIPFLPLLNSRQYEIGIALRDARQRRLSLIDAIPRVLPLPATGNARQAPLGRELRRIHPIPPIARCL